MDLIHSYLKYSETILRNIATSACIYLPLKTGHNTFIRIKLLSGNKFLINIWPGPY